MIPKCVMTSNRFPQLPEVSGQALQRKDRDSYGEVRGGRLDPRRPRAFLLRIPHGFRNPVEAELKIAHDADREARRLVGDLHSPSPAIYWTDLLLSALVGWTAFALAIAFEPFSWRMVAASSIAVFALYRRPLFLAREWPPAVNLGNVVNQKHSIGVLASGKRRGAEKGRREHRR
jgi:hypothetical protein